MIQFLSLMPIADFHSHSSTDAVVSLTPQQYLALGTEQPGPFTVGIHPWDTADASEADLATVDQAMADQRVVALGEAGIDPTRGATVDRQTRLLEAQLSIARDRHKPVVMHVVRRYDIIIRLHALLKPAEPWAVHGFRGKPAAARQLTDREIYLSLGPRFNSESAGAIPLDLLLAETDDSGADIDDVIREIAHARGEAPNTVRDAVTANLNRFYRRDRHPGAG